MRLRYLFMMLAVVLLVPWCLLFYFVSDRLSVTWFYMLELLAVACCAGLWIFYRKVMSPLDTLSGGLDMLCAQDWNNSLRKVGQPEVDKIADVFNEMLVKLKEQRIRYEERTHFLNLLIESAPIGVVILDFDGKAVVRNPAALQLDLAAADLDDLEVGMSHDYRTSSGRVIRCSCYSFIDRGVEHRCYIAEDISGSVTAAERGAYEKVIRVMAHEVNNTMAGFSSALSTALPEIPDAEIQEVLKACWQRSSELSAFTARFAEVVKIPAPRLRAVSLAGLVESERRFLESMAVPKGIEMAFDVSETGGDEVAADPELLLQVLVNIVKNSVESILSTGRADGRITVNVDGKTLTVTDNGAGISPEKSTRLFTPFFTDKPHGQGIGLMFVREVLTAHNTRFSLVTSPDDNLTRFTVRFN